MDEQVAQPVPHRIPIARLSLPVEVPVEQRSENARANLTRGLPHFTELPDYKFGRIASAALVAPGPSAAACADKIREFKNLFACGSVHDWLVGQGYHPKYCVIFDPGRAHARFYQRARSDVIYLVSSTCDPLVFDALAGRQIYLWHPWDDTPAELYGGEVRVNSGCSTTLRAIALAHILGYREQHLFGYDCCLGNGENRGEQPIEVIAPGGRRFSTTPQLLADAQDFIQLYTDQQHLLMCRVYGDGLIAEIMRQCSVSNYEV